jgi:hypothetical protein
MDIYNILADQEDILILGSRRYNMEDLIRARTLPEHVFLGLKMQEGNNFDWFDEYYREKPFHLFENSLS